MTDCGAEANEGPDRAGETNRCEIRLTDVEMDALHESYPGARGTADAIRLAVRDALDLGPDDEDED